MSDRGPGLVLGSRGYTASQRSPPTLPVGAADYGAAGPPLLRTQSATIFVVFTIVLDSARFEDETPRRATIAARSSRVDCRRKFLHRCSPLSQHTGALAPPAAGQCRNH